MFLTHYLHNNLGEVNVHVEDAGQKGMALVEQMKPDLLILDYYLEDTNGLDILRKVKAAQPDLIVIVLSSQKQIDIAVELLREGAHAYLSKNPDSAYELVKSIEKAFEMREARDNTISIKITVKKDRLVRYGIMAMILVLAVVLIIRFSFG